MTSPNQHGSIACSDSLVEEKAVNTEGDFQEPSGCWVSLSKLNLESSHFIPINEMDESNSDVGQSVESDDGLFEYIPCSVLEELSLSDIEKDALIEDSPTDLLQRCTCRLFHGGMFEDLGDEGEIDLNSSHESSGSQEPFNEKIKALTKMMGNYNLNDSTDPNMPYQVMHHNKATQTDGMYEQ